MGKKGGAHTVPQEGINDLIVARRGGEGRRPAQGETRSSSAGGEEAEELAEAGIALEVVPGVAAAVAVPAYARASPLHAPRLPRLRR